MCSELLCPEILSGPSLRLPLHHLSISGCVVHLKGSSMKQKRWTSNSFMSFAFLFLLRRRKSRPYTGMASAYSTPLTRRSFRAMSRIVVYLTTLNFLLPPSLHSVLQAFSNTCTVAGFRLWRTVTVQNRLHLQFLSTESKRNSQMTQTLLGEVLCPRLWMQCTADFLASTWRPAGDSNASQSISDLSHSTLLQKVSVDRIERSRNHRCRTDNCFVKFI